MAQSGIQRDFTMPACGELGIAHVVNIRNFDGHHGIQFGVSSLIHDPKNRLFPPIVQWCIVSEGLCHRECCFECRTLLVYNVS